MRSRDMNVSLILSCKFVRLSHTSPSMIARIDIIYDDNVIRTQSRTASSYSAHPQLSSMKQ